MRNYLPFTPQLKCHLHSSLPDPLLRNYPFICVSLALSKSAIIAFQTISYFFKNVSLCPVHLSASRIGTFFFYYYYYNLCILIT